MHSRLCHLRLPPSRPTSPASPSLELTLTAANKFTKNSPQKNKNTDLQKNVLRFTQICKKKLLYKIAKNSRSRATRAQETERQSKLLIQPQNTGPNTGPNQKMTRNTERNTLGIPGAKSRCSSVASAEIGSTSAFFLFLFLLANLATSKNTVFRRLFPFLNNKKCPFFERKLN